MACSQLLAKLCLVREEIDAAAGELGLLEETSTYYDMMSTTWRLLPLGPAAFVKELLHVALPEKRYTHQLSYSKMPPLTNLTEIINTQIPALLSHSSTGSMTLY